MVTVRQNELELNTLPFPVPVLTGEEMGKIDQLVGHAFVSSAMRKRLLEQQDAQLRVRFGLSEAAWRLITSIKATTLEELCDTLCRWQLVAR